MVFNMTPFFGSVAFLVFQTKYNEEEEHLFDFLLKQHTHLYHSLQQSLVDLHQDLLQLIRSAPILFPS